MKNADNLIHSFNHTDSMEGNFKGLTKIEYFAAMAMQGLLSSDAKYNGRTGDRKALVQDAIAFADELLKQLES